MNNIDSITATTAQLINKNSKDIHSEPTDINLNSSGTSSNFSGFTNNNHNNYNKLGNSQNSAANIHSATDDEDNSKTKMNSKKRKRVVNMLVRSVGNPIQHGYVSSGIGKASFVHALIVIFLEFFAWGLLTDQVITVLNETFPESTFLANGLIHGLKGILSFLSAPLIGAMSDIWGRKVFLLITVFFTCLPIPLMRINTMWYFAMISISGLFAVTFSVVFAYVADVTDESNRTTAYGLVSATFAASLITSPALGSYLSRFYSENFVIALATAIAVFDLFFILVAVPESLPEKLREKSKTITWDNVDPFKSLKVVFADRTISLLCVTVFLSYLPEAGQYSCFFVYLKLIVGFSQQEVAYFIAYVGILSCIAQAAILVILIKYFGSKQSIIIGLTFQVLQLAAYGFAAQPWLIWFSGLLAALSSIGYPAISAYISNQSHADQQGVSQGMVTGIRGLCNGIGPALYGFIFWIFRVNLNETNTETGAAGVDNESGTRSTYASTHFLPGPPFLFGSILALTAIFVVYMIPSTFKSPILLLSKANKDRTVVKIGNSSTTYNRTSSTSSMTAMAQNEAKNLLSSDAIANTSASALMQEQQHLLNDDDDDDSNQYIHHHSIHHHRPDIASSQYLLSNTGGSVGGGHELATNVSHFNQINLNNQNQQDNLSFFTNSILNNNINTDKVGLLSSTNSHMSNDYITVFNKNSNKISNLATNSTSNLLSSSSSNIAASTSLSSSANQFELGSGGVGGNMLLSTKPKTTTSNTQSYETTLSNLTSSSSIKFFNNTNTTNKMNLD